MRSRIPSPRNDATMISASRALRYGGGPQQREGQYLNTTLGQLMERNVSEVFGERDPGRRQHAVSELYADDCAMYAADGESVGQEAVSDQVGRILEASPPDFAFSLVGHAEVIHDVGRLRWRSGPAGGPPVLNGMDVAVFADGKIKALYTFIETPAAG